MRLPSRVLRLARPISSSASAKNAGSDPPAPAPGAWHRAESSPLARISDYMDSQDSSAKIARRDRPQEMNDIPPDNPLPPYRLTHTALYPPRRSRPRPHRLGPPAPLARHADIFHTLSLNPLHEVHNVPLLSSFLSEMGRIQMRADTELTWRSQRLLGKAVRRARAMGVIPRWSRMSGHEQRRQAQPGSELNMPSPTLGAQPGQSTAPTWGKMVDTMGGLAGLGLGLGRGEEGGGRGRRAEEVDEGGEAEEDDGRGPEVGRRWRY